MSCLDICSFIISIVLSIITLIFAILTFIVNKRAKDIADSMNNRELIQYNKEVESKAREFISKYNLSINPEISLLSACNTAYMYNYTRIYKRQIYMDFNNLKEDIQKQIYKLQNMQLKTIPSQHFIKNINSSLNFLLLKYSEYEHNQNLLNLKDYFNLDMLDISFAVAPYNEYYEKIIDNFKINCEMLVTNTINLINNSKLPDATKDLFPLYGICILIQQLIIYDLKNNKKSIPQDFKKLLEFEEHKKYSMQYEDILLITMTMLNDYGTILKLYS